MRIAGRLAAIGLVAVVLLGIAAAPASAHAVLRSVSPADGSELDEGPGEVIVTFSEDVSVSLGGLRVVDEAGDRVDTGDVSGEGTRVSVDLEPRLPDGNYVVSWRVTSADGHPVQAASLFSVGEADDVDEAVLAGLFDAGADRPWEIAAAVARWVTYAGALLAAGGALFLTVIDPLPAARRRRDRQAGHGDDDRARLRRLVLGTALVAAVGAVVAVPLQAALATGLGAGAVFESGVLASVMGDGLGWATAALLAGLALVAVGLRVQDRGTGRVGPAVALGGAGLATASFALSGHTRTTDPAWLAIPADVVHVATAAAWLGGLVLLGLALRARRRVDDPTGAGALVARFSTMATVSVVAVSVAGTALAWAEIRALDALTSTTYGWTLLAKVGIVAAVGGAAAYNHLRLVPLLRGGTVATAAAPWTRLSRTVRLEAVALVVALGITAVLVNVTPARSEAGIGEIFSTTVAVGDRSVNLVVDPSSAGRNDIHLYVLDEAGGQADVLDGMTLELSLPSSEIGPITREPFRAGPGHFQVTGGELAVPGDWQIDVIARVDQFTEERVTVEVPVDA